MFRLKDEGQLLEAEISWAKENTYRCEVVRWGSDYINFIRN